MVRRSPYLTIWPRPNAGSTVSGSVRNGVVYTYKPRNYSGSCWVFPVRKAVQDISSRLMSSSGGACSVSSRFQSCLRAVSSTVRSTAWFRAPSGLRKLPEIFCWTLRGRSARSASLLVTGTVGSRVNRSTSSRLFRSRSTRLCPRRRFRRPRLPFAGGGAGLRARRGHRPRCCQCAVRSGRPAARAAVDRQPD